MSSMSLAEYKKLPKRGNKNSAKSKRSKRRHRSESQGEQTLSLQLKVLKIEFESEFMFHPTRKWRADFHLKGKKILVEVEGGIWSNGRHTRGAGYLGDLEKYNAATMMGYQVIRFSTEQVKSGKAIEQIEKMVRDLK